MKYIKLYKTQEEALGDTIETPNVCGLDGSTKTLYIPSSVGDSVKITKDSDFINYSTGPNANGYEYVDLGLPSGTLWATCNIGATSPEGYGKYFQWGDTVGYNNTVINNSINTTAIDEHVIWENAPFNNGSSSYDETYFASIKDSVVTVDANGYYNLNPEYDAAHILMGGDWKLPTKAQFEELIDNTTSEWVLHGYRFTSKTDTSKSIYIPAAGCGENDGLVDEDGRGCVWSSSLNAKEPSEAWLFSFNEYDMFMTSLYRRYCYSLRGVLVP